MTQLGLEKEIIDKDIFQQTVRQFKEKQILLPTFRELMDPSTIPQEIQQLLKDVDPNEPHPLNLFRIHWFNNPQGELQELPHYIVLPEELTGVKAKIVVLIGAHFPMIQTHKVLAAYGCLAPRVITGQFDPTKHRAIWPSTGNYCRGGVSVSRIMDCHGVAILPEEMSQERFDWLKTWTLDPKKDIIKTVGCESNVKEIYDKCNELDKNPENIIFNQFCEFGNALIHYFCTGRAINLVYSHLKKQNPEQEIRSYISATGSGGTIAAGDYLKEHHPNLKIVAVEALECPTLLYNGFGGHNIQGIGDKHVPLIHNVMNTDVVTAVSDANTDCLLTLFNTKEGKEYLRERGVPKETIDSLHLLGISSICNILAAIKAAKYYGWGEKDVLFTVATDSTEMYYSEVEKAIAKHFGGKFTSLKAAESFGRYLLGLSTGHFLEMSRVDRKRVFNLGYFTWVEQQGVSIDDFTARLKQDYWKQLQEFVPLWDRLIEEFNAETNVLEEFGKVRVQHGN